ncbi:uncharacterized protein BCR38DRAFT_205456 [Pseudomassariella vexata]|uniref:Uncharacterized protein n=1 Tax=Pseudomassariella vexata TaxID=1141098 RepID=A0A1Y2DXW8_9PEZI|nr:uncharacterized protein BCR38DRAFT_205456 [Pseudomassariella vexata]ORY64049.1 hypothetical protein BCR38DRAFT_205456 [Pseudomassariella vexata]
MIVMATAKPPEVVDLTLDVEELRVPYCRPAPTATPLHQHPPPIAPPNNHPANLPFLSIGSLTRPAHAHTPASPLTNGADTPRNVSTRAPLIQAPHLTNGTPRTLPLQTPASRTSLRLPSSRPSSSATDRKPTIGHNEITEDRPAKRQRTGSSLTGQRLHTLIESRMFPLIDDALQQQAPGYGRSAKNKIGYTTCQVLGPKFQREWNETGMLSMGFEEAARREALSLVSELKNRPVIRRQTTSYRNKGANADRIAG